MLHIFYGEDRLAAEKAAHTVLGENYESIDAANLEVSDLPTLFLGTSLFEENRRILIKSLSENKELFSELEKYFETPHEVVLLEDKLDGKLSITKTLKKSEKIDLKEFKAQEKKNVFLAFDIYNVALKNPEEALKMLKNAQTTEDPYMMVGAFASSAIKNLKTAPNSKRNRAILKELAKIDNMMKTTKFSDNPWLLIETFILKLEKL